MASVTITIKLYKMANKQKLLIQKLDDYLRFGKAFKLKTFGKNMFFHVRQANYYPCHVEYEIYGN